MLALLLLASLASAAQIAIPRVELMPNHPRPYVMRDWAQVARDYDAFVFDDKKQGEYLPLLWWDATPRNSEPPGFGLPSYVGTMYQTRDNQHESINCMAAVIGASLVGIDKRNQGGRDFVRMCQRYFTPERNIGLYLNNPGGVTGYTLWYEAYPSLLFAQLLALYPNTGDMEAQFRTSANRIYEAVMALRDETGVPNFDHTAFNFETMRPVDNGLWKEPDGAAAYAWFEYIAHVKTGEEKYLQAADLCLQFLERFPHNPYYESLLPHGALIAARMNAELGRSYDIRRLLNDCFGPTVAVRPGWGVLTGRWGECDVSGLVGSTADGGGYAFAMNTFNQAAALAPIARYDPRFARAIGKYLLNVANAARLFYPNAYSDEAQNSAAWARRYDPASCIAYEGCRKRGRRHAVPDGDFQTAAGRIAGGDFRAACVGREAKGTAYEVLEEAPVGDHDALTHIWRVPLPPAVSRWLNVTAHCEDSGDADQGFRFSFATAPDGPWTPIFAVDALSGDRSFGWGLPCDFDGPLYLKAEDTDHTPGNTRLDRLLVDSIYVLYEFEGHSPFGMGDMIGGPATDAWTDLGLYGSSHVGYLGGIVSMTDVPEILRIDLLKTDWYHAPAHPSYLYFNPHGEARQITVDVGAEAKDLYDAATASFLARNVRGEVPVAIPADSAIVLVLCPAGGRLTHQGNKTLVDGVVVGYSYPTVAVTSPASGRWLTGAVPIALSLSPSADDPIRQVTLLVDGAQAFAGPALPADLSLDTSRFTDGKHLLRATVQTASGMRDSDTVSIYTDNGVGAAFLARAADIAGWKPFAAPAAANLQGDSVRLMATQGPWGGVESPPFELDLDRRPTVLLDLSDPDTHWWAKVRLQGQDPWYIQGDVNQGGIHSLNLVSSVLRYQPDVVDRLKGHQSVSLIIGPSSKPSATVTIRSIRVVYALP